METIEKERWLLAKERIEEIAREPEIDGTLGIYFQKTADFLMLMQKAWEKTESGTLKHASLEELKVWNQTLYEDIAGDAYQRSFANPSYAVAELGETYGQILSFVYAELRGMIVYAYEQRAEEMLIYMELFLQLHSAFCTEELPTKEELLQDVYWFISDNSDISVTRRIREQLDPSLSFFRDIIMEADLEDLRYLYQFGEYITDTEIQTSQYLNTLPLEEIEKIASVFTEGYRIGFLVNQKP